MPVMALIMILIDCHSGRGPDMMKYNVRIGHDHSAYILHAPICPKGAHSVLIYACIVLIIKSFARRPHYCY